MPQQLLATTCSNVSTLLPQHHHNIPECCLAFFLSKKKTPAVKTGTMPGRTTKLHKFFKMYTFNNLINHKDPNLHYNRMHDLQTDSFTLHSSIKPHVAGRKFCLANADKHRLLSSLDHQQTFDADLKSSSFTISIFV